MARQFAPEAPQVGLGLFFIGGGCHRRHLVLARIQRGCHPPDGAAFARGIGAFKGAHQRAVLEALVTHQFRQASLPFGQFVFVGFVGQLEGQVQLGQDVAAVQVHPDHGCHGGARHHHGRELALHRLEQDLAHGQVAVAVVRRLQHHPGRSRRVGDA